MKKEYIADLANKLKYNSYIKLITNYNEVYYGEVTYDITGGQLNIIIHSQIITNGERHLIQDKYMLDKALQIEYLSIRNNNKSINKFIKKIPMVYLS